MTHPTTDPEAELPETVAVHIEWLRRPTSVSDNEAAYHADNHQSAGYLERLLAVAHTLATRADKAETDRDRLAARVQVREEAIADVLAEIDMSAASGYPCEFGQVQVDALRALVSPDTPTSPTNPVDRHEAYAMDAEGYIVPVPGGDLHTDTSTDKRGVCDSISPLGRSCVLAAGHQIRHCGPFESPIAGTNHRERWGGGEEYPGDVPSAGGDQPDTPCQTCLGHREAFVPAPPGPSATHVLASCPACSTDKENPHA